MREHQEEPERITCVSRYFPALQHVNTALTSSHNQADCSCHDSSSSCILMSAHRAATVTRRQPDLRVQWDSGWVLRCRRSSFENTLVLQGIFFDSTHVQSSVVCLCARVGDQAHHHSLTLFGKYSFTEVLQGCASVRMKQSCFPFPACTEILNSPVYKQHLAGFLSLSWWIITDLPQSCGVWAEGEERSVQRMIVGSEQRAHTSYSDLACATSDYSL